jgi:DNA-directed RNA polymerase specialized sigma24 family protein
VVGGRYKPAEIAEHTGLNPRTISSHISQGFKRLRQKMSLPLQSPEGKEVSDG